MRQLNRIVVSVFAKPEEDAETLKQGLLKLVPIDLEQEKIELKDKSAQGFNTRTIHIYTIELTNELVIVNLSFYLIWRYCELLHAESLFTKV